jgi:PAS domain S-box-containing protein
LHTIRGAGGSLASQFRIRRADGSVRWLAMRAEAFLDQEGRLLRVTSAQQDISEIVAAREASAARRDELVRLVEQRTAALAEAEARFHGIFDSQFQFIGLLAPDGTLLEANRTAVEAGGLTRDDVIGRPFWETGWWPTAERDRLRSDIADAARGMLVRHEVENTGAGGRALWVDFSLKPVRDRTTGAVTAIIAEGRDLTERRDLVGKLVQAQKVQALGQLASGIAHDFNNILQTVSGAAMLIERRAEDHDKIRRLARTTIDAAARGESITRRLLSFARRDELRSEAIEIGPLLKGMREVLAHTLGRIITVQAEAPAGLLSVLADRGQLETALVNLGTNARDAMPDGGTLTYSAEAVHVGEEGAHPAGLAPGDYVRVVATDTGSGMDAATLARVTEPFFTTKPPGQGTGLGLAMAKGFAEQSGGTLTIASTPGAGTAVSLWLRQAGDDAVTRASEEDGVGQPGVALRRILVVDDDDLVRETISAQLEDAGFMTLVAASGGESLALIESGETVDALVCDLSMPGMDGVVTIEKARALRPGLPCFLLTGYVGDDAALSAGDAFILIRKPVAGRVLGARIEAALEVAGGQRG